MSDRDGLVTALARRSDKYSKAGDFGPEALAVNRRLTVLAPRGARYWFRLGLCLKRGGQPDKAREAFERGLKIDPDYLVRVQVKRRSEKRAQKKRERKKREQKERARRVQAKREEMERARRERPYKNRTPSDDPSCLSAGDEPKENDKRVDARSEALAVFEEGGPEALRELINYNKNLPGKNQLRLEGRRLLDRQPGADVMDRIGLAREEGLSGHHHLALDLYRQAAGMGDPDARAAATVGAAAVFRRMNEPTRAEELCRWVLKSNPKDFRALTTLGAALKDQGHRDEAEEAFEAAERLSQLNDY